MSTMPRWLGELVCFFFFFFSNVTHRAGHQELAHVCLDGREGVELQNLPGEETYLESTSNNNRRLVRIWKKRDGMTLY
ncbi:hypothetical protein F5Y10DRAFT_239477 [Nemania abortiva]|nr:hypothetical protein F5Y10DRAFT_239477 [Nemania abortiva]